MILAVGMICGMKSLGHICLLSAVHVVYASPPNPWITTMLAHVSFRDNEYQTLYRHTQRPNRRSPRRDIVRIVRGVPFHRLLLVAGWEGWTSFYHRTETTHDCKSGQIGSVSRRRSKVCHKSRVKRPFYEEQLRTVLNYKGRSRQVVRSGWGASWP
jgi:hypothetical protein